MIFRKSFTPPSGFTNNSLCCFPTDEAYFKSDWEAVMDSRESLREWSQSDWPADSFTPEENRKDLRLHVEDNESHSAYGYMLYNPARSFCHGSVYVNPPDSLKEYYTPQTGNIPVLDSLQARVEFWIRDSPKSNKLAISGQILDWIRHEWKIPACFTARDRMADRMETYKGLGLEKTFVLKNNDNGQLLHLYSIHTDFPAG